MNEKDNLSAWKPLKQRGVSLSPIVVSTLQLQFSDSFCKKRDGIKHGEHEDINFVRKSHDWLYLKDKVATGVPSCLGSQKNVVQSTVKDFPEETPQFLRNQSGEHWNLSDNRPLYWILRRRSLRKNCWSLVVL